MSIDTETYDRDRAIEALRAYGQTRSAMGPSRAYLVHDAWRNGVRNISRLAELANTSRDTIYADLRVYRVEVAEDLDARLARWTETDGPERAYGVDSEYMWIVGNGYRRTWVQDNNDGTRDEITLTMWLTDRVHIGGVWELCRYDAAGKMVIPPHGVVAMTHDHMDVEPLITAARERGLSIEDAINHVVKERLSRARLADLHASYRPHWI